jgi:hypothetical protein
MAYIEAAIALVLLALGAHSFKKHPTRPEMRRFSATVFVGAIALCVAIAKGALDAHASARADNRERLHLVLTDAKGKCDARLEYGPDGEPTRVVCELRTSEGHLTPAGVEWLRQMRAQRGSVPSAPVPSAPSE